MDDRHSISARTARDVRWQLRADGANLDTIVAEGSDWRVLGPHTAERWLDVQLDDNADGPDTSVLRRFVNRVLDAIPSHGQWLAPGYRQRLLTELDEAESAAVELDDPLLLARIRPLREALQVPAEATSVVNVLPPLTDMTATRLRRELIVGREVIEAVRAAANAVPIVLLPAAQIDAGRGRMHRFFIVNEADGERMCRAVLAVVTGEHDHVLGRTVLLGEVAEDQRILLETALGTPDVPEATQAAHQSAEALAASVRPLLEAAAAGDRSVYELLRPRDGDVEKAFVPDAVEQVQKAVDAWWSAASPPTIKVANGPSVIDISAAPVGALASGHPLGREFPGAYRALAQRYLVEGRVWLTWTQRAPDRERGTRYDGLVWLDDHWAWFPKSWRAFRG